MFNAIQKNTYKLFLSLPIFLASASAVADSVSLEDELFRNIAYSGNKKLFVDDFCRTTKKFPYKQLCPPITNHRLDLALKDEFVAESISPQLVVEELYIEPLADLRFSELRSLPDEIEQQTYKVVNCSSIDRELKETITTTSANKYQITNSKKYTTSKKINGSVGLTKVGISTASFGGEFSTQLELLSSEQESVDKSVQITSSISEIVPAYTALYITLDTVNSKSKISFEGIAKAEASFWDAKQKKLLYFGDYVYDKSAIRVSGTIENVKNRDVKLSYYETPVTASSAECSRAAAVGLSLQRVSK